MTERGPDQTYVWGQDELAGVLLGTQRGAPSAGQVERFSLRSVRNGVILEVWLRAEHQPSPLIESLKAQALGAAVQTGALIREALASGALDNDPDCGTRSVEAGDRAGIDANTDGPAPEIDPPETVDAVALFHMLGAVMPHERAPHMRQLRAWTPGQLREVAAWARWRHDADGPIPVIDTPEPPMPECLLAVATEREQEAKRLAEDYPAQAKPARKKRTRRAD